MTAYASRGIPGAIAVLFLIGLPAAASAQAAGPPFFGPGVGLFNPQIGVVTSGTVLDAQVVVSHDRRYVTLTTRPQSTQLIEMRAFAFQSGGPAGFVGGAMPVAPATAPAAAPAGGRTSPTEIARQVEQSASVLNQPGMHLVRPLP